MLVSTEDIYIYYIYNILYICNIQTCKLYLDMMCIASMHLFLTFFTVQISVISGGSTVKVFEPKSQEQPETLNEQSHPKHDNSDFQISNVDGRTPAPLDMYETLPPMAYLQY